MLVLDSIKREEKDPLFAQDQNLQEIVLCDQEIFYTYAY
jgi:hypothetical protein